MFQWKCKWGESIKPQATLFVFDCFVGKRPQWQLWNHCQAFDVLSKPFYLIYCEYHDNYVAYYVDEAHIVNLRLPNKHI